MIYTLRNMKRINNYTVKISRDQEQKLLNRRESMYIYRYLGFGRRSESALKKIYRKTRRIL